MCGRFTLHLSPELLGTVFRVSVPELVAPRYNIAPGQQAMVVRETGAGERTLANLSWGLVPTWARDQAIVHQMINARSETVHEKPSFRHAIKYQRCIVPASGFYEWCRVDGSKQPWYIRLKNAAPMGLAGLCESWRAPDGALLESFCLLTTAANSLMAPIHERMPVILPPDEYATWLSKNLHDPLQLTRLYEPFSADSMIAAKVSPLVNSPLHDSAECIQLL
jgi:putative SOS response-associated peptidase YedK